MSTILKEGGSHSLVKYSIDGYSISNTNGRASVFDCYGSDRKPTLKNMKTNELANGYTLKKLIVTNQITGEIIISWKDKSAMFQLV